jgi:hypothetical protein
MISRIWKRIDGFDLDYRPSTYFWPFDLDARLAKTNATHLYELTPRAIALLLRAERIQLLSESSAETNAGVSTDVARDIGCGDSAIHRQIRRSPGSCFACNVP